MCGIAGFSLAPTSIIKADVLAASLLLSIEDRGRHATGMGYTDLEGTVWIDKEATDATDFVTNHDGCSPDTRTALLHTRWGTKGSEDVWENNHPIENNGVVGIHNGVIWNDDDIFADLGPEKRRGQVDSEAIFALIAESTNIGADLERIEGSASLGWVQTQDPDALHLARVSSSPLVIARTDDGSIVFASTQRALNDAATATGMTITFSYNMEEGIYMTVRHGRIEQRSVFATQERILTGVERRALSV